MRMRIVNVVGARPNFMKMAPLMTEYARHPDQFDPVLVHTGQHYDDNMSKLFFEQLGLPKPDAYLGVGSGSHAGQTARIMIELEKLLVTDRPALMVVVGDVNSTMAAAVVAAKLCIPVAHVEAGLRSFDRTMPEEINRVVTDTLSDYCFTTCADAGCCWRPDPPACASASIRSPRPSRSSDLAGGCCRRCCRAFPSSGGIRC